MHVSGQAPAKSETLGHAAAHAARARALRGCALPLIEPRLLARPRLAAHGGAHIVQVQLRLVAQQQARKLLKTQALGAAGAALLERLTHRRIHLR